MHFLFAPISLAVLLFLPGWAWRLAASTRRSRLLSEVVVSVCCTTWVGFLLAELGVYSLPVLVLVNLIVSLAGWLARRRTRQEWYGRIDFAGVALAGLTLALALPPLDTRLSGGDSSTYIVGGENLAASGSLVLHDPLLDHLSLDLKRSWFPSVAPDRGSSPYVRLTGSLILRSLDTNEVLPGFHHAMLVWVALAQQILGDGTLAVSFFGALSVWAIFTLLIHLDVSSGTAVVWTVVFARIAPQLWYSRFLMPEVATQALIWGGLAVLAATDPIVVGSGLVVGLAFGVAGMLRIESAAFVSLPTLYWLVTGNRRHRRAALLLFGTAALLWLHAALHLWLYRTHYWGNLFSVGTEVFMRVTPYWPVVTLLMAFLLAAAVRVRFQRLVQMTVLVAFAAMIGAAVSSGRPQSELLATYVGLPLCFGGIWGAAQILWGWQGSRIVARLVLLLMILVGLQWLLEPRAMPVPLWTIRRAVPILIPALLILTATAVARRAGRVQSLLALALVGFTVVPRLPELRSADLYSGSAAHIQTLAPLIPRHAVILLDASLISLELAPNLWLERDASAIAVDSADSQRITQLLAAAGERPVVWVASESTALPQPAGWTLNVVGLYEFGLKTPDLSMEIRPGLVTTASYAVAVYRFARRR